jgi:hypothetical protein
MSKNEWKKLVGVAGRMLLAFVFVFSQTAWAGQDQKTKDKADSPQNAAAPQTISEKQSSAASTAKTQSNQDQSEESEGSVAEEKSPGDGRHEGIKIHGHWTIEVRNPDGTVATHREFENSLLGNGAQFLGAILGRHNAVGAWSLSVSSSTVQPCVSAASPVQCTIAEPALGATGGGNIFSTLSVSVGATGSLLLSGTAVAGQSGTIDTVQSADYVCANTVSPSACPPSATATFQFTQGTVNPAVNVSLGQTVAVTVTFTFS